MAGHRPHRDCPSWTWLAVALFLVALIGTPLVGQIGPGVPYPQVEPLTDATAPPEAPIVGPDESLEGPAPPSFTSGEKVVEVQVVGRKTVPIRKMAPFIRTRAGRPLDMELIEEDVRRLNRSRLFVSVKPMTRKVPGGRIVIFEVVERPVLQYVKYVGNEKVRKKVLGEKAEIKVGDALDPFAVEEGRRKIEDFYRSHGFGNARVTIIEGNNVNDKGVIYLINEGQKQRIFWTSCVGNTIATDARLRTQIEQKQGFLWLFKGEVNRKEIEEDKNRLKAYYASLGFFDAKIGAELDFNESRSWLTLTYVIDEGPRYKVRNVRFVGPERFTPDELAETTKLKQGEFFNQTKLNGDVNSLQEKYGALGYVFADIKPDIRYLEQPGQADLVYEIKEGDRYRVGRIDVQIRGEDVTPHTKISTVLNRMSLVPGDICDIRELRSSERRLKASGLFLMEPQRGIQPKIVFSPPDVSDEDVQVARKPRGGPQGRGQSPDGEAARDRWIVLTVQGELSEEGRERLLWEDRCAAEGHPSTEVPPVADQLLPGEVQPTQWRTQSPGPVAQGMLIPPPVPVHAAARRTAGLVARGQSPQITAERGEVVPNLLDSQPFPGTENLRSTPQYRAQPNTNSTSGGLTLTNPPSPVYGPSDSGLPSGATAAGAAGAAAGAQPSPIYTPNAALPAQPAPRVGSSYLQPPSGGILGGGSGPMSGLPPDQDPVDEALRSLPLQAIAEESRTGRIMLGVGVTSDAGLIGSVVVDEQNFDLFRFPHSWEEIRNGTAWRGAGQRFRAEAVPGTEVQRYMVTFTEPYFLDTAVSTSVSGYFYNRIFQYWSEERVGGTFRAGYQFRPDLTGNFTFRGERVGVYNPGVPAGVVPELDDVLGNNALYGFRLGLAHDTRDSAFLPTEGHLVEFGVEQVIGSFQYPRADIDVRKYFTIIQRPDGSGRHVLSVGGSFAISGEDTPLYDHYFAGGFSSLRGFDFRGASPRIAGVPVGGKMQLLSSIQYLFPITADDALRGVVFCDAGTVEREYDIHAENFRVATGFGLRVTIPAMGPAPLAFDFAWPICKADGDVTEVFSFFIGLGR